ncbi:MAG: hypothetical protein OXI86_19080, partial [Candidatus Poribacteria bacterium]|nr:hypothetical protein [Candidatus Poribacteria bacterium]
FYELRSISERYTVSLALLGGYLCFLNRSRNECEDAALLAQTFLTEIAIYDSIFASAHARELQSYEYLDWIDRHPRFEPLIDDYDEAFALNAAWVKKEDADDQVNEAKLRVEHQKLPSEYLSLILEEEVRLSQPNHDLEYDFHRSWIIQKHIAGAMQPDLHPPVSIEGIMKILKKWDDAGRHLGWQSLVIQRCQELERLDKLIAHVDEADPVEDDDFAETLWNQGEQFWRTSDW